VQRHGREETARGAAARVIAVGGGKGGVGKSVLAANMALAMAGSGHRVALVDADVGMGNQHTLLGISRPGPGLAAFLRNEVDDLDRIAVASGYDNLVLYPSDSAQGVPQVSGGRRERLLRHLCRIDADVLLLDIGAGASLAALDLFTAADLHVLVITGQLTSIQNAYGFLKAAVQRLLQRLADTGERRALVEEAWQAARPPALAWLGEWLGRRDPELAAAAAALGKSLSVRLVGNLLFDPQDQRVPHSIARMIRDYLGIGAEVIGLVPATRRVHDSITQRRPILLSDPHGPATSEIRRVADRLLSQPLPAARLSAMASGRPSHE
jgi:flagellar biosynthesis protein FlhG